MFNQNPIVGPGSETLAVHTLEIIVLLTIAFLLGLLLCRLLGRGKMPPDPRLAELESENVNLNFRLKSAEDARHSLEEKLTQAQSSLSEAEKNLGAFRVQMGERDARISQLEQMLREEKKISTSVGDLHKKISSLEAQLTQKDRDYAALEARFKELQASINADTSKARLEEQITRLTSQAQEQVQALNLANTNAQKVKPLEEQIARLNAQLNEKSDALTQANMDGQKVRQLEEQAARLNMQLNEKTSLLTQNDEKLRRALSDGQRVRQLEEQIERLNAQLNEKSDALTQANMDGQKVRQLEEQAARLNMQLNEKTSLLTQNDEKLRRALSDGQRVRQLEEQIERLNSQLRERSQAFDQGEEKWQQINSMLSRESERVRSLEAQLAELSAQRTAAAAKIQPVKGIKKDDLKVVEGIGPKIARLLNADGITTWEQLSRANVEQLRKVLERGGQRFMMHDPETWPEQAGLLARGEWDKFKALTDILKGGRRV